MTAALRRLTHFLLAFFFLTALNSANAAPEGRWLATQKHADIAYFLSGAPAEIARYDLVAEQFLSPILLVQPPTAFTVDDDGIYVASAAALLRMDLDGSNLTPLTTLAGNARELVSFGASLYVSVQANPNFVRIDKTAGTLLGSMNYFYAVGGLSVSAARMKIFGRSLGISPADIFQISLGADGVLGAMMDSRYHGDYPGATQTFVFPDQAKVIDDAGIVYSTTDLEYQGSLSGSFSDIAFAGGEALVLRDDDSIDRFSTALLQVGSVTVTEPVHTIYATASRVVGFYNDGIGDLETTVLDVSAIAPPEPGVVVEPQGLSYVPDAAFAAVDGSILVLSKANRSIFRWSNESRSYTQSIPLADAPKYMGYSMVNDGVYLAYDNGRITQVDLVSGVESPFASLPSNTLGFAIADPYVFGVDPSGAWVSHFTFDPAGQLISQVEWNYTSQEFIWNAVNQKMYFFRDGTSPNDLIWEDIDANGVIGAKMDSPYHSSLGISHPIRAAANGSFVLLGSGRIYNAITLDHLNTLANAIVDANWVADGSILSIRDNVSELVLQEWSRSYALEDEFTLPTTSAMLVPLGPMTHVIWQRNGIPVFFEWFAAGDDIDGDGVDDDDDLFPADPDESADSDSDGIGDNADPDDDNDGEPDGTDAFPFDPTETRDSDSDGIGNNADPDDDNDGEPDAMDAFPLDPAETRDTDNDGIGNNADSDDDNDGEPDATDAFPLDQTETHDADNDGIGDNADPDDDNDGEPDVTDAFPLDPTETHDSDSDGVGDNADAFPDDPTETVDSDNDGVGNNSDDDDDNDGESDATDAFPLDPTESQDSDVDGIGNNADPDDDNDGEPDVTDAFPFDPTESRDTDSDGIGNNADSDDDNDEMPDDWEIQYGLDPLSASDANSDLDNDGVSNLAEFRAGTDPTQAPSQPPPPPSPPPASQPSSGGGNIGALSLVLLGALAGRRIRRAGREGVMCRP